MKKYRSFIGMIVLDAFVPLFLFFNLFYFQKWWVLLIGLSLTVLLVVYRIRKFVFSDHPVDAERSNFKADSWILLFFWLLHFMVAFTNGTSSLIDHGYVIGVSVLYLLLRMAELWMMDRLMTDTKGSSQILIFAVLVMAVVFAFWGIPIVSKAYVLLFFAISFLAFLILPNKLHIRHSHKPIHLHSQPTHTLNNVTTKAIFQPLPGWANWLILILLWLVVVAVFVYLFRRLKRRDQQSVNEGKSEIRNISRNWFSNSESFTMESTDNPMRIKYQEWLLNQHRLGVTIKRSETSREFMKRASDFAGTPNHLKEFTEEYERNRYRR